MSHSCSVEVFAWLWFVLVVPVWRCVFFSLTLPVWSQSSTMSVGVFLVSLGPQHSPGLLGERSGEKTVNNVFDSYWHSTTNSQQSAFLQAPLPTRSLTRQKANQCLLSGYVAILLGGHHVNFNVFTGQKDRENVLQLWWCQVGPVKLASLLFQLVFHWYVSNHSLIT